MRRWLAVLAFLPGLIVGRHAIAQDFLTSDEGRVEQMVNTTRAEHGLAPLGHLDGLQKLAREQAVRMVEAGNIFHNAHLASDITSLHLDWLLVGENVGVGPTVDAIEDAFLGSPHHYENIVREAYTSIGVGVVSDGAGRIYVAQVFGEIQGAPPAFTTPAPVAPAPTPTVAPIVEPRPKPTITPTPAPTPRPEHVRLVAVEGGILQLANCCPEPDRASDGRSGPFAGLVRTLFGPLKNLFSA